MTRFFLSALFTLLVLAGPAGATNITAAADRGEDSIRALRGLAETMLKESSDGGTVAEGEELIVKGGGKAGTGGKGATEQWQAGLAKLGNTVQLGDIAATIQDLRQNQAESLGKVRDIFKDLSSLDSVSEMDQKTLLKNIERQTAVFLEDQVVLAGLRLRVEIALASADTIPAQRAVLQDSLKQISASQTALQGYQNDAAKMARTEFKTKDSKVLNSEQIVKLTQEAAAPADALASELQANPKNLSQDFFVAGLEQINETLASLTTLREQAQELVDKDPADMTAQAALKQLSARITQIGGTLRDMAVVEVPRGTLSALQDNTESISNSLAALKNMLETIKTKKDVTQADVDTILMRYDELAQLYTESKNLGDAVTRGMGGQKYQTAEQTELLKLLAGLPDIAAQLGGDADVLQKGTREAIWAAFLKERQEAAAQAAALLALSNDVTAATLHAPEPIVAKYLPLIPTIAHSDVSAELSGKLLGDVLVKDGIIYGVTVKVLGPTTLTGPSDIASINQAQLEVFRIENGNYTSTSIEAFEIYAGAPHAALSLDGSGFLSVFLNNTQGDKNMQGVLYKLDAATLTAAPNPQLFTFGDDQGWYPYIDENGKVQNLSIDAPGVFSKCADSGPCAAPVTVLDVMLWADALKAAHSNFTFNTAATPAELPTDVVAKRLTGQTGVTALGNYDYLSWGKWNDGAGVVDTIYTNSAWIAGSLTPAADIPATGSASYSGQVVGKLSEGGVISAIGGTTALTANFAGNTLTGTFDMTKNNAAWKTANVNAGWGAGTGNIAGTLNTTDAAMSGAVNGNFFGPAANQMGGAWNLSNAGGTDKAAGVFTGDKQSEGMITNSK